MRHKQVGFIFLVRTDTRAAMENGVKPACMHPTVLGVLRCDWSEVASIVGVAVTPVIGFMGDLTHHQLKPNPDEVSHCFTIPVQRVRTPCHAAIAFQICACCRTIFRSGDVYSTTSL
jgi:hypothetical protein